MNTFLLISIIIASIFFYLVIGSIIINLLNQFDLISDTDIKYEFGIYVFFFPIIVIYISTTWLGKWIAKTIYDKYRKYKYDKSVKFYVDKAKNK
jgi:hypothetical protein